MAKKIPKNRSRAIAKRVDGYVDHDVAINHIAASTGLDEETIGKTVLAFFEGNGLGKYARIGYKAKIRGFAEIHPNRSRTQQIRHEITRTQKWIREQERIKKERKKIKQHGVNWNKLWDGRHRKVMRGLALTMKRINERARKEKVKRWLKKDN